jgi:hypothetical protein
MEEAKELQENEQQTMLEEFQEEIKAFNDTIQEL